MQTLANLQTMDVQQDGSTPLPLVTRVFYNKTYLSVAMPLLLHDQFGVPSTLPKNSGESVMWRRFKKFAEVSNVLVEGVTPTGKTLEFENVVATVKPYGDFAIITDWVDFIFVDPIIAKTIERLAEQSGESLDAVTRDIINAGTNVFRVTADGASPTWGAGARTTVNGTLNKRVLDAVITSLVTAEAKMTMGRIGASPNTDTQPVDVAYPCIIHPHITHSLFQTLSGLTGDHGFLPRERYGNVGTLYKGEVGKYRNIRFIETTHAKVWPDSGGGTSVGTTSAATYRSTTGTLGDVYSCLVIGKESYGVTKLAGYSQTYVERSGGNSDPLHQRNTVGWKAAKTAAILQDDWLVRIEVLALW